MEMDNSPFADVFPTGKGGFPLPCWLPEGNRKEISSDILIKRCSKADHPNYTDDLTSNFKFNVKVKRAIPRMKKCCT